VFACVEIHTMAAKRFERWCHGLFYIVRLRPFETAFMEMPCGLQSQCMLPINQIAAYKGTRKICPGSFCTGGPLVFSQNTESSRTAKTLAGKGPFPEI
jgi:hypothetical protein